MNLCMNAIDQVKIGQLDCINHSSEMNNYRRMFIRKINSKFKYRISQ